MELKSLIILLVVGFVSAERVQIPCSFSVTSRGYTCRLPDVNLGDQDYEIVGGNHLPGNNDQSVISFVSINNNFRSFPGITRFANLRHIQVTGSLIERIEANDIGARSALQSLNLDNNQISTFDDAAFAGVPNLSDVSFRFNRIRNLFPAVFDPATSLTSLDFSYNLIERLSNETLFRRNTRIEALQFSGNNIDYINAQIFSNLGALNLFDFSSNLCYSGVFFGINQPTTRNQMLQRLQPCFTDAPINARCQFSIIEMNNINAYGCVLRDLKVYNRNRRIAVGGFHIAPNTNNDVRYLRIEQSHTPFVVRELFEAFPNLEGFEIIFSDLTQIDAGSFANATNLRYINIRDNSIRRLEANSFQGLTRLEQLRLWWNRDLSYINENAFNGLESVYELQIITSSLPSISPRTFRSMTALETLDLGQNRLEYIDSRWFSTNRQLRVLNLNSNIINAIHRSLLDLPSLMTLSLQGNRCTSNIFFISDRASRDNVRNSLLPCFDAYPTRKRRFVLDVEGDVTFLNDNGNEIIVL